MTALIPARIFRLAFATAQHPQGLILDAAAYPAVNNATGPLVNRMADCGDAWDIAVLDDSGDDVTHLFPCFTDHAPEPVTAPAPAPVYLSTYSNWIADPARCTLDLV